MNERILGQYRLVRQLAVGGMAEIYVATAAGVAGFEKQLALKVIHPNFSSDPEFVRMLVDEAKLAVQLQHANIVQTYDLGKVDESYYIVMELIDGVDLFKILRRTAEEDHYIPFEMAVYVAHEVATGLDYAHRKRDVQGRHLQIVHRDVSPQNILVSYAGEVKIVDFGIAKARRGGSRQTAVGVIKGKYYYMSPEQAWGDPVDGRTDIFSAGILLYEMLVGEMLYYEEDFERLLDQVRKADIRPPSTRRQGIPADLDEIVMTALEARPGDRFQTAGEFGVALSDWLRANAPEFTPTRLGAFVGEVAGARAKPEPASGKARGVREETAEVASVESLVDENSLIFRLADLASVTSGAGRRPVRDRPARERSGAEPTPAINLLEFEESESTSVDGHSSGARALTTTPDDELDDATSQIAAAPLVRLDELSPMDDDEHTELTSRNVVSVPALVPRAAAAGALPGVKAPSVTGRSPASVEPRQAQDETSEHTPTVQVAPRPVPAAPAAPRRLVASARVATPERPAASARVATPERPVAVARVATPAKSSAPRPVASVRGGVDDDPRMGAPRAGAEPRLARRADVAPRALKIGPDESTAGADVPTREWRFGDKPPYATRTSEPETPPLDVSPSLSSPLSYGASAQAAGGPAPARSEVTNLLPAPRAESGQLVWLPGSPAPMIDVQAFPTISTPPSGTLTRAPVARGWWIAFALMVGAAIIGLSSLLVAPYLPSRGVIEVVSLPGGATVKVDGHEVTGTTPLRIDDMDLKMPHRVAVALAGYDGWEREVQFDWGKPDLTLQAVLAPLSGTLKIDSAPPGAEVIVNGRFRGQTPVEVGGLLPTDDVTIELRLRGYRVEHRTLAWGGRRSIDLSIHLDRVH